MPRAVVGDIEISYELHGSGDPVMLLVGLPGVGRGWGPQIDLFAEEFLTIVPDQRGAGQSGRPDDGYTIEQHAADMAELLHELECGPAHLVGSSTGGAIAQVMAADHPDVVRSITVMGSWATPDDFFRHQFHSRKRILEKTDLRTYVDASALFLFSSRYFRDHYDQVRSYCDLGASKASDPRIMKKRIDMILASDQRPKLASIRCPALVLCGDGDTCTPPYFSEELAELIPGAEFGLIPGGHLVYWENPDEFFSRVTAFIGRH